MTAIDYDEYIATHAAGGWPAVLARWPHYPYADAEPPRIDRPPSIAWRDSGDGRIRVGLLCPVLYFGGAEQWQLSLAKSLDPCRIEVVGCVVTGGEGSTRSEVVGQFKAIMPIGYGIDAARDLAARCDVLIQWAVPMASIVSGLASKPRVIAVSHSPIESTWATGIYRDTTGIDDFVAVHDLAIPPIPEAFRAAARVIWNAVTESRLTPTRSRAEMRAAWGVPSDAYVVGYIGRLEDDKNPASVASATPFLSGDTYTVVVGDGWDRDFIGANAHERFKYVGPDPDAGSVIAAFDTLVVPSLYESFGLSLAEGLWCERPVVSTAVGIAKGEPWLTRPIPYRPDGPTLAGAIMADRLDKAGTADRVARAKAWADERLSSARFGREWSDLIADSPRLAPSQATLLARVASCPDRGSVLPVSMQPEGCGCKEGELSECRAGRGNPPGSVTLRQCLECKSDPS